MKFWLTLYRIASVVLVVLVIIAIISAFLPLIRNIQEGQHKITAHEEENRRRGNAYNALRKQNEEFSTDPKNVEKLAREELGKAKAGEIIYRFGGRKTNDHLPRRK